MKYLILPDLCWQTGQALRTKKDPGVGLFEGSMFFIQIYCSGKYTKWFSLCDIKAEKTIHFSKLNMLLSHKSYLKPVSNTDYNIENIENDWVMSII